MECVVLAAGEGKRMRPLTAARPKVMLPIANRPMVEHLVIAARDAGITRFVLVVGYGEREVRKHFGNGSSLGVSITYVVQRQQRGTADALKAASKAVTGPFLLMNGDMLLASGDIRAIAACEGHTMGVYSSDHPEDYGVVEVRDGLVTSLVEKSGSPESNLINAGVYRFEPEIIDLVSKVALSPRGEYEITDALAVLIKKGRLSAYSLEYWLDAGYPWDLLDANAAVLGTFSGEILGTVEEGVFLQGNVAVGKGTVLKSGTYIEGPCVIGEGCRVGPHAYIRGATSIGDGCHIGHSIEIKNSVILPGTNIPHFNYVGDSVIGSGCNLGAGTKIANLRHDRANIIAGGRDTRREKFGAILGDNVKTGINCSINAGTVIGSGVLIAPHASVEGTISAGTKVR